LSQQFDVHPNQIKQWKDQLLEGQRMSSAIKRSRYRRVQSSISKRCTPRDKLRLHGDRGTDTGE
jgi:transposase-like protein